jgi:hypothetical protein
MMSNDKKTLWWLNGVKRRRRIRLKWETSWEVVKEVGDSD